MKEKENTILWKKICKEFDDRGKSDLSDLQKAKVIGVNIVTFMRLSHKCNVMISAMVKQKVYKFCNDITEDDFDACDDFDFKKWNDEHPIVRSFPETVDDFDFKKWNEEHPVVRTFPEKVDGF